MFVLALILLVILFGLGFVNPLWWLAGAVLLFGVVRGRARLDGRGGETDSDYARYRDDRVRRERWDRRYRRQNRDRWTREDRRDEDRS
ncbi:hypothetical protein [Streptomyces sp. NPDC088785]|uniref:hypothetical protein n=1 Tax=Streptomyces sp. NPDC088785 TaxID=3365897 RepID=UPI00383034A2